MSQRSHHAWSLLLILAMALLPVACIRDLFIVSTVADMEIVHEGVQLDNHDVTRIHRVVQGGVVETNAQGRARLRLDDGTIVMLDGSTKLTVSASHLALERGRIFVVGGVGARATIELGETSVMMTHGHAGIERTANQAEDTKSSTVYAATGELVVHAGGKDYPVRSGESASIQGAEVRVTPTLVYDDWTGGMAAPWSATGQFRRVVGTLLGAGERDELGSPLTHRSQDVSVTLSGEMAATTVLSKFFHAGEGVVMGDFRMALPSDAIVSGFAATKNGTMTPATIGLARGGKDPSVARLDWAGEGWVRGTLGAIEPGAVVEVMVRYVQWMPRRGTDKGVVLEYRYPLASDTEPPIIGEFSARIETKQLDPRMIRSGHGATVQKGVVILRKSDFRPTADFVVEVEKEAEATPARLYVAEERATNDSDASDRAGAYLLVRAEVPNMIRDRGARVAVVLDTSSSMDAGALDVARNLVEALVRSLGPNDHIVVFATDSAARPIGPNEMGPVDDARRTAILQAMSSIEPAGATDLGIALETAADSLESNDPSGMVLYIGDGWPTVGDLSAREIRSRLARRKGGAPRLAAVPVGALSNRMGLASLVREWGPLLPVNDKSEAVEAAHQLLAEALQPTVASARLDLGPSVEQVYPLRGHAVVAGSTIFAVGRSRETPPTRVTLRYQGKHREEFVTLATGPISVVEASDIRKRWGTARVDEFMLRSRGQEAVIDVALREQLMTPWTGWVVGGGSRPEYPAVPIAERALDLTAIGGALFSSALTTPNVTGTALLDFSSDDSRTGDYGDRGYEWAVSRAVKRKLDQAIGGIRACRDARAALRPDITGTLSVNLQVDGNGQASDVKVTGSRTAYDTALFSCVESVISGISFPASGLMRKVKVTHTIQLPPGKPTGRTTCSATAQLPLQARRGVWGKRLEDSSPYAVYFQAKLQCELPNWTAKRTLLELALGRQDIRPCLLFAKALDVAGETDAAEYLRREVLRRARTPEDVRTVRETMLQDEGYPVDVFEKQYKAAGSNTERLAVVRKFLQFAPHDIRLRRHLLTLLAALDDREVLKQEVANVRRDLTSDATLLADAASVLRQLGEEERALQMFFEIVERAPKDPWARAYAGDRLQREGWHNAALLMYAPLEQAMASDPAVLLRMALAHAGAERIDLAGRMLTQLSHTRGRSVDSDMSDLARDLAALLLLGPHHEIGSPEQDEMNRRAMELPMRPPGTVFLVQCPNASPSITVAFQRGPKTAKDKRLSIVPDISADALGLYRFMVASDDNNGVLRLAAKEVLPPWSPISVKLHAIVSQGSAKPPLLVSHRVDLPQDGKVLEIVWDGTGWR